MIPEFRDDGWLPPGHHKASWPEIVAVLGRSEGSQRYRLTQKLLALRQGLKDLGIAGTFLLDGSYISAKPEPHDFDVLLIGSPDIQASKDSNDELAKLLDAETAETERGYSLFYIPDNSPVLSQLRTLWDISKEGVWKGIIEVDL